MRRFCVLLLVLGLMVYCQKSTPKSETGDNPLLVKSDTPFGAPDFNKIKPEHYVPAVEEAIRLNKEEIETIVSNSAAPDFDNTIAALSYSGRLLAEVQNIFYAMNESMSTPEMQEAAKVIAEKISTHSDDISMNPKLFVRVQQVWGQKDNLDLNLEQQKLLDYYYKQFVRQGAALDSINQQKLREINQKLSQLTLKFGDNTLAENDRYQMLLENEEDLAGLPAMAKETAAEEAAKRGLAGKWVFTVQKSSLIPFITYADNRCLREKLFKAYIMRGDYNDSLDNKALAAEIVKLRLERANLLGYKTHAHYVLEENMAKEPQPVYDFLLKIWKPALAKAQQEVKELQDIINKEDGNFKLEPWDWWYYAEKLKKAKYDLSEEELRPYFQLQNVIDGVFSVANRLYGIQFKERSDLPKYHPDVKTYEVINPDSSVIGILYVDYYPREGKRGGAWMNNLRDQYVKDGLAVLPIICNNGNFTKPTASTPSLLTLDEVETLFHEFGHGLHGLLSKCVYPTLSGTAVARDFVELPSQIMENWALEPEVLQSYAKHYQTGEPIPQELIDKINKSSKFNQGFITTEYLSAALLDLDWHTYDGSQSIDDVNQFEKNSLDKIGLIPEIIVRYRTPYFNHIFSGGYSAGYYSYIWAEVLDADAFDAFKSSGDLFNQKYASAFRKCILEKGGTEDPMKLYKEFRGADPSVESLLKRRGLKN